MSNFVKELDNISRTQWKTIYTQLKDINNILELLPKNAMYYFTEPQMPRKLDVNTLFEKAKEHQLNGIVCNHPKVALGIAKSKAHPQDLILVMGSFFVLNEIL